jgi:hypothetical protein
MPSVSLARLWPAGAWGALWWLVASAEIGRHLGIAGLWALLPGTVAIAAGAALLIGESHATARSSSTYGPWLAAAIAVALFVVPDVVVAATNNDTVAALDHAVAALGDGRNPYLDPLRPDHPLMHLPGSLVLGAPFHWAGSIAWQNPFWAALFVFWVWLRASDPRRAGLCLAAIAINPAILKAYITGSDFLTAAIILLLALSFTASAHEHPGLAVRVLAALGVAIALCTHPVFWVLLPLIARCVRDRAGTRAMLGFVALLLAVMVAICLPFYLDAPDRFGLTVLLAYTSTLPQWLWIFPAAALILACLIPLRDDALRAAGIVFAVAAAPPLAIALAATGHNDFTVLAAPALLFPIAGRARLRPQQVPEAGRASFSLPPNH